MEQDGEKEVNRLMVASFEGERKRPLSMRSEEDDWVRSR